MHLEVTVADPDTDVVSVMINISMARIGGY